MEHTVKERLIEFMKYKGLSQAKFEKSVGLSNGYINQLRHAPSIGKLQIIISAYPDLNPDWLLHGTGDMLKASDNIPDEGLPMLPIDAMAGALSGVGFQIRDYECEHYNVPNFSSADFLITVSGDSMQPTFLSGDILAVKKVPKGGLWFQWGKPYVIATRQGCIVKRIMPSKAEGCVTIVSDNAERYPKFDLSDDEINGIGLVVGLIRSL